MEPGSMAYTTLISPQELADNLNRPDWVILDCRFALADPGLGRSEYLKAHIPSAQYAHLDEDLSGPVIPGVTGRHPLPAVSDLVDTFGRWGIKEGVQVVAYDDTGGAVAAGRAWWLLRWLGHEAAAVLDGGWSRWLREGRQTASGIQSKTKVTFSPHIQADLLATAEQVDLLRNDPAYCILDARSADRFRGENETIDPVAGHIPGAISAAYSENLSPDGTFHPIERLKARYEKLLKGAPADHVIIYCGSGVTAVHDILAMEAAGLGEAHLYAGSWSEWITDPHRPVATGE